MDLLRFFIRYNPIFLKDLIERLTSGSSLAESHTLSVRLAAAHADQIHSQSEGISQKQADLHSSL
jgi:hypothetical protein